MKTVLLLLPISWLLCAMAAAQEKKPPAAAPFVHPGLLHSKADLDRMKKKVAAHEQPWQAGFEKFSKDGFSQPGYRMQGAYSVVTRSPLDVHGNPQMVQDCNAAYQNAVMWCITGNEEHAEKALKILNAWSGKLKRMDGRDVILSAGLNGFKLVNAAELMRYTYPEWKPEDVARMETLCKEVILPPIHDFATFANGNWDAACIKTMMAIGVFCNDRALFDRAVEYYRHGEGNGAITHYVLNEAGQCQESGRDQQHTQLGLGALAEACEVAWHQGVDLYGEADNRLLKGFEYTAKYNLGNEVPFVPDADTTGTYKHKVIADDERGLLRPVYEMVYHHYQGRKGLAAPFVKQAAEKLRPEGAAFTGDHPGFGTLLFSLPVKAAKK